MATTATIVEDIPQGLTHRNIKVRFTHDTTGESVVIGPRRFPADEDLQAFIDGRAQMYDDRFVKKELQRIIDGATSGKTDVNTMPLLYHTRLQARRAVLKVLFNSMRDANGDEQKLSVIRNIMPMLDPFTDAQIASIVGWSEAEVGTVRAKLVAFASPVDALDHGLGDIV